MKLKKLEAKRDTEETAEIDMKESRAPVEWENDIKPIHGIIIPIQAKDCAPSFDVGFFLLSFPISFFFLSRITDSFCQKNQKLLKLIAQEYESGYEYWSRVS